MHHFQIHLIFSGDTLKKVFLSLGFHRKSLSANHSEMSALMDSCSAFQTSLRQKANNSKPDDRGYEVLASATNENTTLNTLNNSMRQLRMSTEKIDTIDEKDINEEDIFEFDRRSPINYNKHSKHLLVFM
jgi:hypothetical protein